MWCITGLFLFMLNISPNQPSVLLLNWLFYKISQTYSRLPSLFYNKKINL